LIPNVGEGVVLDDEVVETTLEELFVDTEELELDTLDVFDVLDTTVDVLLDELLTLVVDAATLLLLDEAREVKRYISRRFPAPQYS
jgi:hypothetical protein